MLTSKKIGSVAVDSGQIMVGDPCYLRDFKSDEFRSKRIYVKSRRVQLRRRVPSHLLTRSDGSVGRWISCRRNQRVW